MVRDSNLRKRASANLRAIQTFFAGMYDRFVLPFRIGNQFRIGNKKSTLIKARSPEMIENRMTGASMKKPRPQKLITTSPK